MFSGEGSSRDLLRLLSDFGRGFKKLLLSPSLSLGLILVEVVMVALSSEVDIGAGVGAGGGGDFGDAIVTEDEDPGSLNLLRFRA